jgi:phosphopantetheinyl transferase
MYVRVMPRNLRSNLAYLCDDEIHFWIVQLDRCPINDSWHLLSADEQDRAKRFRFEFDKVRFANGRSALRRILGRYLGVIKEAFLEAIGEGLSVAPNSLEADSLPARLIDVHEGFVAAVATPDQLPSCECLIFRDLGTFDESRPAN